MWLLTIRKAYDEEEFLVFSTRELAAQRLLVETNRKVSAWVDEVEISPED